MLTLIRRAACKERSSSDSLKLHQSDNSKPRWLKHQTKPLEDEKLFTTQIYAQSLLDFHARLASAAGAYIVRQDQDVNKYLNLLDGLALLLVKKQGDVVATSFRLINSSLVFY